MSALPESVQRLQVFERGWLSANNILLMDEASAVLIDSGYVAHAPQTLALVQQALNGRNLDLLLNTHLHSDHCGGNQILQTHYPKLQTWIPPGLADAVATWDDVALTYKPTGQDCPRFHFQNVLTSGQSVRLAGVEWQVHAAPGHDPHSVILYEPHARTLISADALWQYGFGVVFPELQGIAAFHEVAQTLDLIESLAPKWVIPGHGAPFHEVSQALDFARQKLQSFMQAPEKHARYGAKVLIKFKLLEWHHIEMQQFTVWAKASQYLTGLHAIQSANQNFEEWLEMMLAELIKSKAIQVNGNVLQNI